MLLKRQSRPSFVDNSATLHSDYEPIDLRCLGINRGANRAAAMTVATLSAGMTSPMATDGAYDCPVFHTTPHVRVQGEILHAEQHLT